MTPVSMNIRIKRYGFRREPASKRYRRINDWRDNRNSPCEPVPPPALARNGRSAAGVCRPRHHAGAGYGSRQAPVVATEVGDGLSVWPQPEQLEVAADLRLKTPTRSAPVEVAEQMEFEHVARIIAPAFRREDARDDTRARGRMNRTAGAVRRSGTPGGCYCGGARASWVPGAGWPARSPQLSRCDDVPG